MPKISSKLPNVGTTIFTQMSQLAIEHDAINLAQGFPNFDCDRRLQDLLNRATRNKHNQYAPMSGVPALREVIKDKIQNCSQVAVDVDAEITITSGATQAIFSTILALVRQGDEVIVIDPAYDSYKPAITLAGGIVKAYTLRRPDFKVDWDEYKSLVTDKTRLLIVNTPHNPTGTVMTKPDWEALYQCIADRDILVLSDEVYEHIIFEGNHHSVLEHKGLRDRAISVSSFGKTLHCTGWKVGYAVASSKITAEIRKVHQFTTFSVHTPSQYAIAQYIDHPSVYENLALMYRRKRDLLQEALSDSRLRIYDSQGTFFMLCDYSELSDADDVTYTQQLVKECGVATIPLSVFHTHPYDEKLIRLCFAKTDEVLLTAADRLCKL